MCLLELADTYRGDQAYFDKIANEVLTDEAALHFWVHLLSYDLSGWRSEGFPDTPWRQSLRWMSQSTAARYLQSEGHQLVCTSTTITALHRTYTDFCTRDAEYGLAMRHFAVALRDILIDSPLEVSKSVQFPETMKDLEILMRTRAAWVDVSGPDVIPEKEDVPASATRTISQSAAKHQRPCTTAISVLKAWSAILDRDTRLDLTQHVSALGRRSWLHDCHMVALLQGILQQMRVQKRSGLAAVLIKSSIAALLPPSILLSEEERELQWSSASIADYFDFTTYRNVVIPLNVSGAGGMTSGGGLFSGVHWSILIYTCEPWPIDASSPPYYRADHYDSSPTRSNTSRAQSFHRALGSRLAAINFPMEVRTVDAPRQTDCNNCGCWGAWNVANVLDASWLEGAEGDAVLLRCRRELDDLTNFLRTPQVADVEVVCTSEEKSQATRLHSPAGDATSKRSRTDAGSSAGSRRIQARLRYENVVFTSSCGDELQLESLKSFWSGAIRHHSFKQELDTLATNAKAACTGRHDPHINAKPGVGRRDVLRRHLASDAPAWL